MTQLTSYATKATQHRALPQITNSKRITLTPMMKSTNSCPSKAKNHSTALHLNCTPSFQSPASSSTVEETFADLSGCAQGPAEGPHSENFHGPHSSGYPTNTPPSLNRRNLPVPVSSQPTTNTTHPLPDLSYIAQVRENLTLYAQMQDTAYITGCMVWSKPYDQVMKSSSCLFTTNRETKWESSRSTTKTASICLNLQFELFVFVPGGRGQAATCDGKTYDITYGSTQKENQVRLLSFSQDGCDHKNYYLEH